MKFLSAFFAICLISASFAATTTSKAAAAAASEAATRNAMASLKRITSTRLGKTLLDTLQVELRASVGTDPRPRILQLLREILEETNDQIQGLNEGIGAVRQQCDNTKNQLDKEISDLEEQISTAENEQAATKADLASLNEQYNADVLLSGNYQSQLDTLNANRAQREQHYNTEITRLQKIRSTLEQVRVFITDRLDQRNNPSFLQRNNVLVEVKRKVMAPEFQRASAGWGKFINFLATKALEKIKQSPDDTATEGLSSIVNVISDLLDNTNQQINARTASEQNEVAAYENARDSLEDVIRTTSAQIASLELNIGLDQDRLDVLAGALESNNRILTQKQSDASDNDSYCKSKEEEYTELFSQRNQEAEVIQEVIEIVEDKLTNLSAAVENVVNSAQVSDSDESDS